VVYRLKIAGVERPLRLGSLSLQTVVNGRHVMSCAVLSEAGAYRPTCGEEAELLEDDAPIFGGVIRVVEEAGADGLPIAHISSRITCDSFNVFAERRFVTETIPAGSTLKQALEQLDDYLTGYGVTLDAAQVTGPTLDAEQTAYGQALNGVLDTLSQRTGFLWEIDATKTFRMFEPGTAVCPIDIVDGDGHHTGDITVERSRDKYVNRVIVKGGKPGLFDLVDAFVADGVEDTFRLRQPIAGPIPPVPTQDGAVGYAVVDVGPTGSESLAGLLAPPGVLWEYDPVAITVHRRPGPPDPGPFQVRYQAQYPIFVTAEDAGQIALYGIFEAVYEYPDIYDQAVLQELAESLLSQGLEIKTELTIQTRERGVRAGQSLTVTAADRAIDGEFLITEVNAGTESTIDSLLRTLKCVEGSVFQGSFRGLIKAWLGSGSVAASAGPPPGATGGVPHPPDQAVQVNRGGTFGGDAAFRYYETENSLVCGALSSITAAAFESCQVFGYDNHIADP
jgi:hypothetical protein